MKRRSVTSRDFEVLAALDRSPLTAGQLLKLSETFTLPFTTERRVREPLDKAYLFKSKDEYLHDHALRLKEKLPFGTGTEQLRPAIREQREKKATREAVKRIQNLREPPTVRETLERMSEEAEAAQRDAAQLRATGTDGGAARAKSSRQAKQKRPPLRLVREPEYAPAPVESNNLRELADLLASQVQSDPEGSESW